MEFRPTPFQQVQTVDVESINGLLSSIWPPTKVVLSNTEVLVIPSPTDSNPLQVKRVKQLLSKLDGFIMTPHLRFSTAQNALYLYVSLPSFQLGSFQHCPAQPVPTYQTLPFENWCLAYRVFPEIAKTDKQSMPVTFTDPLRLAERDTMFRLRLGMLGGIFIPDIDNSHTPGAPQISASEDVSALVHDYLTHRSRNGTDSFMYLSHPSFSTSITQPQVPVLEPMEFCRTIAHYEVASTTSRPTEADKSSQGPLGHVILASEFSHKERSLSKFGEGSTGLPINPQTVDRIIGSSIFEDAFWLLWAGNMIKTVAVSVVGRLAWKAIQAIRGPIIMANMFAQTAAWDVKMEPWSRPGTGKFDQSSVVTRKPRDWYEGLSVVSQVDHQVQYSAGDHQLHVSAAATVKIDASYKPQKFATGGRNYTQSNHIDFNCTWEYGLLLECQGDNVVLTQSGTPVVSLRTLNFDGAMDQNWFLSETPSLMVTTIQESIKALSEISFQQMTVQHAVAVGKLVRSSPSVNEVGSLMMPMTLIGINESDERSNIAKKMVDDPQKGKQLFADLIAKMGGFDKLQTVLMDNGQEL
ncbi:uncharacterized protein IL334_007924 [Kwoniella shivajii]|uniref:Uncharacterized protein n=1 Tax=Kwoniella shivajii TaxID=564305 RepID=A0ABZ1DC53_9TREE|nr:hypothetical protein IL334_007924 [Kwoniella shivajii]